MPGRPSGCHSDLQLSRVNSRSDFCLVTETQEREWEEEYLTQPELPRLRHSGGQGGQAAPNKGRFPLPSYRPGRSRRQP